MLIFKSLLLGIVQGLTEFFPVSSSAHLKLISMLFNIKEDILFDLCCHLGTTIAAIIFLRKDIINIIRQKHYWIIFLAILPLFPVYFLLKSPINYFSQIKFLPFSLLLTSLILFICSKIQIKENENLSSKRKIKDVLLIGVMQAFALIPGLSRSGWTISSGYLRGWKIEEAIKFSFLLAIPTILGGNFLEGLKYFKNAPEIDNASFGCYLIGFLASLTVGFLVIKFIFLIRSHKKLKPFAWYLLGLAFFSFIYLYFVK
ncbi:MAG: undecaprenyl-diphosphate phosphatase [Parachlamydiales bacterium]